MPAPARLPLCPDGESYFVFVPFSGTLGIQETLLKSMLEIFAFMRRSVALTRGRRYSHLIFAFYLFLLLLLLLLLI